MFAVVAIAGGLLFSKFYAPLPMGQARVDESDFRPVFYGGELASNACRAVGEAAAANREGVLTVHSGPGRAFGRSGLVASGKRVWVCDEKDDWVGIVYTSGFHRIAECGADIRMRLRLPYAGPCEAGWVPRTQVRFVTGGDA